MSNLPTFSFFAGDTNRTGESPLVPIEDMNASDCVNTRVEDGVTKAEEGSAMKRAAFEKNEQSMRRHAKA